MVQQGFEFGIGFLAAIGAMIIAIVALFLLFVGVWLAWIEIRMRLRLRQRKRRHKVGEKL